MGEVGDEDHARQKAKLEAVLATKLVTLEDPKYVSRLESFLTVNFEATIKRSDRALIAKAAVAYGTLSNTFDQLWTCWEDYLELLGTTQEEMEDAELVFNKNRIDAAEDTDIRDKEKTKG